MTDGPAGAGRPRPAHGPGQPGQPDGPDGPDGADLDDVPTVRLASPQTRASLRAEREAAARDAAARHAAARSAGLEGRSPLVVVPTALASVAATVALALLVALSAAVGPLQTALALGLTGLVLAWGWPLLLSAPTPGWSSAVIGLGSVAIALTAGLTREEPVLRWLPATIGVSIVLGFLQQLLRRERSDLTLGLSSTVAGLALATAGAPLAALPHYPRGPGHVAVAMAAVAAAAGADLLAHLPAVRRWVLVPAVVAGVAGALLVAHLVGVVQPVPAVVLGVLAGGVSHIVRRILAPLPDAGGLPARLAVGAASVLVVGVLVYLATRLVAA